MTQRRRRPVVKRLLVFDTETTGLLLHPQAPLAQQPRIIEFGAVVLERGTVTDEMSWLVNPEQALPAEIVSITGLTDAQLIGAPTFGHWVPRLRTLFGSCDGVVAHNLPFDKAMLMNDLRRVRADAGFPWPRRELCTVGLYRDIWGYGPRLKELYEDLFGKPLQQTHRALDDVRALVAIVRKEMLWRRAL